MTYQNSQYNRITNNRGASASNNSYAFDGKYTVAYTMGAAIREKSRRFDARRYEAVRGVSQKAAPRKLKKSFSHILSMKVAEFFRPEETDEPVERVVKPRAVAKGLFLSLFVITLSVISLIGSYSYYCGGRQAYSKSQDMLNSVMTEQAQLVSRINLRDDVREIEEYATENIGMVQSDYVETRHLSVAGGERIEVVDSTEETPDGIFSTMLSAMGSYRETILEYID